ncbi:hypothetical protein N7537_011456 [Penicillium hordei]|uniref:Uncharacterized protein n=1 Tax=Penicillium hordei TaxID=40994 RepID=A0AAD6GSS5_9EURO|nr:uncharacterized protein N7537_011456 [Penicillium hordei]KAJ5588778.1 hypothetical protein N7537_011456 [Penicillium hordei]
MENGLSNVAVDAVSLQGLCAQHQAQDNHRNPKDAPLVDLAVLETGIVRVRGKYGFIPLGSDDPIILQQQAEDLDSKKVLCYQRLDSEYQEHKISLGYRMHEGLPDWYGGHIQNCLRRLEQLA